MSWSELKFVFIFFGPMILWKFGGVGFNFGSESIFICFLVNKLKSSVESVRFQNLYRKKNQPDVRMYENIPSIILCTVLNPPNFH